MEKDIEIILNEHNQIAFIHKKLPLGLHPDCQSKRIIEIEMMLFADGIRGEEWQSVDYDYAFEFDNCEHCIGERKKLEEWSEMQNLPRENMLEEREIEEERNLEKHLFEELNLK